MLLPYTSSAAQHRKPRSIDSDRHQNEQHQAGKERAEGQAPLVLLAFQVRQHQQTCVATKASLMNDSPHTEGNLAEQGTFRTSRCAPSLKQTSPHIIQALCAGACIPGNVLARTAPKGTSRPGYPVNTPAVMYSAKAAATPSSLSTGYLQLHVLFGNVSPLLQHYESRTTSYL